MGREEVQEFLKNNPSNYFNSRTIALRLGVERFKVTKALKVLAKTDFVKVVETGIKRGKYKEIVYKYVRGGEMIKDLIKEVNDIAGELGNSNRDYVVQLLILKELRELNQKK